MELLVEGRLDLASLRGLVLMKIQRQSTTRTRHQIVAILALPLGLAAKALWILTVKVPLPPQQREVLK